ncbi:MAG: TolC family protein [Longimicrobiales bacterium]
MRGRIGVLAAVLLAGTASLAGAQQAPLADASLSLQEALARALEGSEEVLLARAQLDATRAQVRSARSAALPQVNTQLGYTKTLRSVFQDAGGGFTLPDSLRFEPDTLASIEDRISYLERRTPSAGLGALGSLFSDLPFGNENTWVAGLSLTQPLFTGGRLSSSINAAEGAAEAAAASLDEAGSDIALQVKQAYYDAVLADRSAGIVETSVELAAEHLAQVRLRLDAGTASELESLTAEVELENLRPQLVQARNARDLALLDLKRLVNLPAEIAVTLTTELDGTTADGRALADLELPSLEQATAQLSRRASLRAAEAQIAMREEQADIARSAYLPSLSLSANFNRQAFPTDLRFPNGGEWRDDWNLGFMVQWPLFQGFRRDAELDVASARVRQSKLQLDQLREGVRLEYERALRELERTQAQVAAVRRTVEQAERVYELTELRYREGLATQLDVSNARLALQQASINQVQSYHDAYAALASAERALGLSPDRTTLP